jgi:hypothetical protein
MTSPRSPLKDTVARIALGFLAVVALDGCLPQDGTGTSSGTSASSGGTSGTASGDAGATTTAGKACLDTAAAYATAAKRCGGNYDAEYAAFIRDLANGDCNSVDIRNETELRTQCFPSLARILCDDLKNNRVDPSCAEQIIRPK